MRLYIIFLMLTHVLAVTNFAESHITSGKHNHTIKKRWQKLINKYHNKVPVLWSDRIPGVKNCLNTKKKVIALTFDACGSEGDGCDYRYINFLKKEQISATIFVSNQWIKRHPRDFKKLIQSPLFDIQNHGLTHAPCSVNGKSMYNIQGTKNIAELIREIEDNARIIQEYTGKRPKFYRSGAAYYDEIAIRIAHDLGHEVVGFDILGDAGATWPQEKVKNALLGAKPGSIIILHINKPKKDCAHGAIEALKILKKRGFKFVKLSDHQLI